jgi:hypothetical protein
MLAGQARNVKRKNAGKQGTNAGKFTRSRTRLDRGPSDMRPLCQNHTRAVADPESHFLGTGGTIHSDIWNLAFCNHANRYWASLRIAFSTMSLVSSSGKTSGVVVATP